MPDAGTPEIQNISLPVSFSFDKIFLIVFLCMLAGYIIYSVILYYHWSQYATSKSMSLLTLVSYFVTTIPLMIFLGIIALAA